MPLDTSLTESLFFCHDLTPALVNDQISQLLRGCDDGEMYFEYSMSDFISLDDGQIRSSSYDCDSGFGLRAVHDTCTSYAYSSSLTKKSLERALRSVKAGVQTQGGTQAIQAPKPSALSLYHADNPLHAVSFEQKVALLQAIDHYLRNKDSRVKQVSASISASWKVIHIMRPGGVHVTDIRPMVHIGISTVLEANGRMESGRYAMGGREHLERFISEQNWKMMADEAFREAEVNLASVPAPAGEMVVVLGSGWPGVLLHEAVGHGLEGDFNRKKTSAFSDRIGQQVAAKGVTVIDDGTIEHRRGSLHVDDEGTPTQRNVLIEDGMLKGYMQDRMNARLMGVDPTGNGRRESFACQPMPRMTNTFMLAGNQTHEEIIQGVKKGVYAANFSGGQVDITSGKFVFSASEAYLIEDGKVTTPIKGATLIGDGPDVMTKITAIGNNLALDSGIGTCGKEGQSVPVGVGLPTLRIDGITVGGTDV